MPARPIGMPRPAAALAVAALSITFATPAVAASNDAGSDSARSVTGATAIARAKVWVDNHVTYSQTSTYQGYRKDCSGYVSMAWGLTKPGYTTYTMPQIGTYITKSALKPGDAILNSSFHVLLFEKWANSAHTYYWAYEESSSHNGALHRMVPYPYWSGYGTFKPFRYRGLV